MRAFAQVVLCMGMFGLVFFSLFLFLKFLCTICSRELQRNYNLLVCVHWSFHWRFSVQCTTYAQQIYARNHRTQNLVELRQIYSIQQRINCIQRLAHTTIHTNHPVFIILYFSLLLLSFIFLVFVESPIHSVEQRTHSALKHRQSIGSHCVCSTHELLRAIRKAVH